ncbi:MAG: hypothetical protein KDC26_04195 [Armatimonadetes bacterium]|nr:hypothetical protein [Armatimonadota bacterium]
MTSTSRQVEVIRVLAAVWVGVVIAGNLIAPTAKFQAPHLDLAVALEVGRATFRWMLVPEVVLSFLLVVMGSIKRTWIPIALLASQWLLVMPALDARTLSRINGEAVGSSSLHLLYIGLELAKLIALAWIIVVSQKGTQSTKFIIDDRR